MPKKRKIVDRKRFDAADSEHPGKGVLLERPRCGGLRLIRYLMRTDLYEMAPKVYRFIEDGAFTPEDIERAICTGHVQKMERDELGQAVGNKKYVIVGYDMQGYGFYTVGKIMASSEGKIYYVITAHSEGEDYDDLSMP
jgi:hypothetical protein